MLTSPDDVKTVTVAVVNDFEVVVRGVAAMLAGDDRVRVVEMSSGEPATTPADVVLFDTFGNPRDPAVLLAEATTHPISSKAALYTWEVDDETVERGLRNGFSGVVSKTLPAVALCRAIVRLGKGEIVVERGSGRQDVHVDEPTQASNGRPQRWPGRDLGLSEREAEVLTLITKGLNNQEIAETLHLSINSVKTHIRRLYGKIRARDRSEAILFGVDHGFRPPARR